MNKILVGLSAVVLICIVIGISLVSYMLGTLNLEASSRNKVVAQAKVVESHFDKMWKVIQQKTQITKASADHQKDLVKTLVEGRAASFIKIISESNPQVAFSLEQFNSLSNSIEAQREGFFREQEEMIDIGRENHLMFDQQPSGVVLALFGREKAELPEIISSSTTKEVIESGKEDNIDLSL